MSGGNARESMEWPVTTRTPTVVRFEAVLARLDAIEARLAKLEPPADVSARLDEVQAQIKRVVDDHRTEF